MREADAAYCGNLLSQWLARCSSAERAKEIAEAVGYKDSPLFGARKRKAKLVSEVVMVNTAMTISAVNSVLSYGEAKAVIDVFLDVCRAGIFAVVEKEVSTFRSLYPERMQSYFGTLAQSQPDLAISHQFMGHLGVPKALAGQLALVSILASMRRATYEMLQKVVHEFEDGKKLDQPLPEAGPMAADRTERMVEAGISALQAFTQTVQGWPEDLRTKALNAAMLFLDGKKTESKALILQLPRSHLAVVVNFLEAVK